ncbi:MAG: glycosyltransferase [Bryobacteraceae bacterium]
MKRVLFYCQHVLGMGHLVRSLELVRALRGFDVTFLNGGAPVEGFPIPEGVRVVNLPAMASDCEFRDVHAISGAGIEAVKELRSNRLLAELERFEPHAIILELFPFGRRKFAFEILPLLDANRRRPRPASVISSVRDILVSKRDQQRYEAQTSDLIERYFDLILVHADPQFQRLEETFPAAAAIRCPIRYTGFVARRPKKLQSHAGVREVVASIGGGRVGFELLEATLNAAPLLPADVQVQLFTGPFLPEDEFSSLCELAADKPNVQVDRFTSCFVDRLALASVSVSMAGYNTCMDILSTGIPALVYPFRGNGNLEQSMRASRLEKRGGAGVLATADLEPAVLANRIRGLLDAPGVRAAAGGGFRMDGAQESARLVREMVSE